MGRQKQFDEGEALEAAMAVFWRKGYEGTSFEDLSAATGVARPGLYATYGNKESLYLQALDLYESKYLAFVEEALNEADVRKVVERILRGNARVHTMDPDHSGCMGLNGALACSDGAESIRVELARRRAASQAKLRQRFERAQQEGALPPTAEPAVLASYVMAIAQGMAVQAKGKTSKRALDQLVSFVLQTWPF